tara:strand:+ start:844 stop:1722 length:879 start_codon:yes stop_codon:yes gene_type:complete
MKRLAVVVCGWHFPDYFYKQLPSSKIPEGWKVDYFCISHRNPEFAIGEKNIDKNHDGLFQKLDYFFYKDIATINSIEKYGWKYIQKPNTLGDWGVFNQWIEDYDYRDYDMFLLAGDDNFIINDNLLDSVLGNKFEKIWSNGDVGNYRMSEVEYDNDWLVLANNAPPKDRGMLRGSFDFFKFEIIDMLGGKFDFSDCDLESRLKNTTTPTNHFESVSMNWNNQCVQFMKFIEDKKLYPKIRFLSNKYRMSNFCIEGERGLFSNINVDFGYKGGVIELHESNLLNKFLKEDKNG